MCLPQSTEEIADFPAKLSKLLILQNLIGLHCSWQTRETEHYYYTCLHSTKPVPSQIVIPFILYLAQYRYPCFVKLSKKAAYLTIVLTGTNEEQVLVGLLHY